jgi:hypothetical protein
LGFEREEVTGGKRRLLNERLYGFCTFHARDLK